MSCWWTFSPKLVSGLFQNLSTGKHLDPEMNSGWQNRSFWFRAGWQNKNFSENLYH